LKFANASVIESLRRNHELCNIILHYISDNSNNTDTASYGSNCVSLTLSGQQQQSFGYISDDIYTALILEEAEKFYNGLTTIQRNETIAAAVTIRPSSVPTPLSTYNNHNRQN
jgi:hypothetical protein